MGRDDLPDDLDDIMGGQPDRFVDHKNPRDYILDNILTHFLLLISKHRTINMRISVLGDSYSSFSVKSNLLVICNTSLRTSSRLPSIIAPAAGRCPPPPK